MRWTRRRGLGQDDRVGENRLGEGLGGCSRADLAVPTRIGVRLLARKL